MGDVYAKIIGHEAIKRGLAHAVAEKRLHHADAFTFLRCWLEYHTGKPIRQRDSRCSSRA